MNSRLLRLQNSPASRDSTVVIILMLLWLLFFWRLFTPNPADQASLVDGDFSRQFVTFGAYQYERFAAGEVPLWNPYNNGGFPFIADPQSAVFYPPRLITIALSRLGSGWSYNALQMEMTAHILLYTLLMYIFMRRLLLHRQGGVIGALVAAIVAGYGGFITGYPPLQLALLEAAIWLPLGLLGILEATRTNRIHWSWLAVTGLALGLCWLAGHPQTGWFSTYTLIAFLGWRIFIHKIHWSVLVGGTALIGFTTIGLAAVTLLPGVEYLTQTTRADMGFDAKGGGFPFQDVAQLLVPGIVSLYSPLYAGITGLLLALAGLAARERDRIFWAVLLLVALGLSFGANAAPFHALYNVMPGLSYFRGQERSAYVFSVAIAVLAGMGITTLIGRGDETFIRRIRWVTSLLVLSCGLIALAIFTAWIGNPADYGDVIGPVIFSALIAIIAWAILWQHMATRARGWLMLLVGVLIFELFSANIDNTNYESTPAEAQPIMQVPPLIAQIQNDERGLFRIDGSHDHPEPGPYRSGNGGSLYGVQDIRGISPLFLSGPHTIIERGLPSEIAWELFAVRYVITRTGSVLPYTTTTVVAEDVHEGEGLHLHRLNDPRSFAMLLTDYVLVENDRSAFEILADPAFDPRQTIILEDLPDLSLPEELSEGAYAEIMSFAPEEIAVRVQTPENAILSLSLVDYSGWSAKLNGNSIPLRRAYGALTAFVIPPGEHELILTFSPLSFRIGAALSLFTLAGLTILGIMQLMRRKRYESHE